MNNPGNALYLYASESNMGLFVFHYSLLIINY